MDYVAQKGLRRHANADIVSNTKLSFAEHAAQSGICSICSRCAGCEIGKKAKTGNTIFPEPFGTMHFCAEKRLPNLEDLQIIPELYGNGIDFRKVKLETEIGGFKARAPVVMSALDSAPVAQKQGNELAIGAALAGIPMVVGENFFSSLNPKALKERIKPFLDNYKKFGAVLVQGNAIDQQLKAFEKASEAGAMGIELKLGNSPKMGLGCEMQFNDAKEAKRFEKLGFVVIKENGSFQRHGLPGSINDEELRSKLIKYSELGLPIWINVPIGSGIVKLIESLQRIKREQGVLLNCLTVEGFGCGTAMSPWLIMNETGLPSAALFGVLEDKPSFDIILGGGYSNGADVSKALMLGAKGAAMSRAFLIAASAVKDSKKNGVENFVKAIEKELQFFCATQRIESVDDLHRKKKNLFALTKEACELFGASCNPKTLF